MTKELIKKFKEKLLKRKEDIELQISKFAHKNSDGQYEVTHEEYGNSDEENSDEIEDELQNESLLNTLTEDLQNIEKALERADESCRCRDARERRT